MKSKMKWICCSMMVRNVILCEGFYLSLSLMLCVVCMRSNFWRSVCDILYQRSIHPRGCVEFECCGVSCVIFSLHDPWEQLLKIQHGGTKITKASSLSFVLCLPSMHDTSTQQTTLYLCLCVQCGTEEKITIVTQKIHVMTANRQCILIESRLCVYVELIDFQKVTVIMMCGCLEHNA